MKLRGTKTHLYNLVLAHYSTCRRCAKRNLLRRLLPFSDGDYKAVEIPLAELKKFDLLEEGEGRWTKQIN